MKKHILFIVENNPVPNDVRVWAEAIAVKELGYDVSVICPLNDKTPLQYECIEGIAIYRHYTPWEAGGKTGFLFEYANAILWELLFSIRLFICKRFHMIHAANPPDHLFLLAWLFKIFKVKFIFDHHDICPENYIAKFMRKDTFYYLLKLMEKLTFKTADIVISTNQSYKQIAIERGGKKTRDVFVVRNGPRLNEVEFLPPNPKWKSGFEYLAVYVGVIGNQEGLDGLLRMIGNLVNVKKVQNIKFVIIGTGPDLKNMLSLCEKMQLQGYVEFTGYIPYHDFYEILATADVAVNPEYSSPFTDKSTMIKIMDYMTFGLPIVQFRTTEGMITAGDAAIYIDNNSEQEFADAIIELLGDKQKMKKMGEIGKKRIFESLNWDFQKRGLKEAYQSIMGSSD
jgi:glycosyltransferase involved in cell wall biosynthesis